LLPFFSVVVPTFNDKENIRFAIDSILKQTFKDFEIIIVDDDSTDGTTHFLRNIYKQTNILILEHETNKGVSAARNTGIKAASGKYIALLDSDDTWYSQILDVFYQNIEATSFKDFYFCCGEIYNADNPLGLTQRQLWVNHATREKIFKELYLSNFIAVDGVVINKSALLSVGLFNENLHSIEDYDLWLRLSLKMDFYFIDQILFRYNIRENSLISNIERRLSCQTAILYSNAKYLKLIVNSNILYYIIKRRAFYNMYEIACWDATQRGGTRGMALLLAFKGAVCLPNRYSIYQIIKLLFNK